jgi:hypothetical protein
MGQWTQKGRVSRGEREGRKLEAKGKGIDTRPTGGDDEDGTFDGSFGHSKALRLWTEGNTRGRWRGLGRAGAFTYLMVEIRYQRQTWDLP